MKQWKHKIKIKHLFEDETSKELIVKLCNELLRQLNPILKIYETSDDGDTIFYELETCVDNFEFLKNLADGTIKSKNWDSYGFDGDFQEFFNDYLNQLYDLGDSNKLIWIG